MLTNTIETLSFSEIQSELRPTGNIILIVQPSQKIRAKYNWFCRYCMATQDENVNNIRDVSLS